MRYTDWYSRISAPFASPRAAACLRLLDKALPYAFAGAYAALLAVLAFTGDARIARAIAVPATVFLLVSVLRAAINAPRPYESHPIEPIIAKSTRGKSMPSRHVASAFAIAFAIAWISPAAGVAAVIAAFAVAFTRIAGGTHFPRDAAAAILIALALSAAGYLPAL